LRGATTITARDCVAGICGAATDTVSVTILNVAPALTQPVDGQKFTGSSLTASAAAGGGGIAFLVDGKITALDGSAPFAVQILTSAVGRGTHAVWAAQCNAAFTACDWDATSPAAFIEIIGLSVRIKAIAPGVISPNGDRRSDAAKVVYVLDRTQKVVVRIKNAAGSTVIGPLNVGNVGSGTHAWTWNGRTRSGAVAANGRYAISLSTSARIGGVYVTGLATGSVRVDTSAPRVSGVGATLSTFYPYRDNYRDYTWLRGTSSESARLIVLQVFDRTNRLVRSSSVSNQPAGGFGFSWNGRNNAGASLPAGAYGFRFVVRDSAGNERVTSKVAINLSPKRIRPVAFTQTMTPSAAFDYMASGSYWASSSGGGAQVLWGGDSNGVGTQFDLAAYSWPMPSSLRGYSSVRLEVCSGRAGANGPEAASAYINPTDYNGLYSLTNLGNAANTCYRSSGYATGQAMSGRTLGWVVGNTNDYFLSYWEIVSFRITGTRYVLS